jgi:type III secretion protein V
VPPEEVVERARVRLQREYGFDVPPAAITLTAAELPPAGWRVEVGEAPVARGVLVPTVGPGLPPDERLALDCAAAWRRHAGPLLGVQAVSDRLSRLESTHPALLRAVVPRRIDVPRLARLLQRLLAEDVPIRDLAAVLEALAVDAPEAEQYRAVRRALGPVITHRLAPDGRADAVMCAAAFEEALRREAGPGPAHVEDVVAAVRAVRGRSPRAAVLVAPDVRERAVAVLGSALPDVPIVSAEELLPGTKVTPVAVVGE